MKLFHSIEVQLQFVVDCWFAILPCKRPDQDALKKSKIVSHRGEHDNRSIRENTVAAFDAAADNNAWGIELDIRWSADLHPVVIHDTDCLRVFGSSVKVSQLTLAELHARFPEIPTLEEVILRYGKKLHLMVELKQETFPDISRQRVILEQLFAGLAPAEDYHILALEIDILEKFNSFPSYAMLPVAELNYKALSRVAIDNNYAGVCGQYLLISNRIIGHHDRCCQKVGTGFARSRFSFYREINRGVEWVFTNHATKLSSIRKRLLDE